MKCVWSGSNLLQCDLLKAMLETNGIACLQKNVDASRWSGMGYPTIGGFSAPFAWPELWVDDADEARALEVIATFNVESDPPEP